MDELECHLAEDCQVPVKGGIENAHGKVNVLLQTFISRASIDSFSLVSDMTYVAQVSVLNANKGSLVLPTCVLVVLSLI